VPACFYDLDIAMPLPENYLKIGHPETDEDDLRKHADHKNHLIRLRVAEHPRSPSDVLRMLANDDNAYVSHRATRTLQLLEMKTEKHIVNGKLNGNRDSA
jgi:hypothetical protein